jgi:hypothetical protein
LHTGSLHIYTPLKQASVTVACLEVAADDAAVRVAEPRLAPYSVTANRHVASRDRKAVDRLTPDARLAATYDPAIGA